MRTLLFPAALALLLALPLATTNALAPLREVDAQEFTIDDDVMCQLRKEWTQEILATYPQGSWAPLKFEPTDDQLQRMGLPPSDVLLAQRYPVPTLLHPDGSTEAVSLSLASWAGTGCFGIRPGAFLLLLNGGSVGWCSFAHVYGSPGSYKISTAGHCGKAGDVATVVGVVGNRLPVLIDVGKFSSSTDGGIGNDKALISVDAQWQNLVSPTMCAWGGPIGSYTKTGAVVDAHLIGRSGRIDPSVAFTPDPFLAQAILHYGHGTGTGAGGTPRVGLAQHWGSDHFAFFGTITPGDSGSGANTAAGDALGAQREAAGIITHIYVDPSLETGIGTMAGTRVTRVGTPTDGQLVPYPVPLAGAP